jgi:mRNA interferase MazF
MTSGTPFDPGEIVLVPLPFTDLGGVRRRPVLVLSAAAYNRRSRDFVVCGITSNLGNRGYSVELDSPGLASGAIPAKSLIKADKVFTLGQSLAVKRLSRVKPEILEKVKDQVRSVMGLRVGVPANRRRKAGPSGG